MFLRKKSGLFKLLSWFYPRSTCTRLREEPHGHDPGYFLPPAGSKIGPPKNPEKYTVVRELGRGGYGSVWLVELTGPQKELRALKIMNLDGTQGEVTGQMGETDILKYIFYNKQPHHRAVPVLSSGEAVTSPSLPPSSNLLHPGRQRCTRFIEAFFVGDEEGRAHNCCTFELLGGSLAALRKSRQPRPVLPVATVKTVLRQVLQALDFLHSECGAFHCDLKPENILLELPRGQLNEPNYCDGLENSVVPAPDADLATLSVKLCDFGCVNWVDRVYHNDVGAFHIRPPEVILEVESAFGPAADIWALGCMVFELFTGRRLWAFPEEGRLLPAELDRLHLYHILEYTENETLPVSLTKVTPRAAILDKSGKPRNMGRTDAPQSLRRVLGNYNTLDSKDADLATEFMLACFALDPAERPSAKELLRSSWLSAM